MDWLAATLGQSRVTRLKFTALFKAALGSRFIAIVETGRSNIPSSPLLLPIPNPRPQIPCLQPIADPRSPLRLLVVLAPGRSVHLRAAARRPFDLGLRWSVPDAATVSTPADPLSRIHV